MASSSNAPATSEESVHQQQQYGEEKWTASPQKKRKRAPSAWRRNVEKKRRDSGQEYKTYKDITVQARRVGPPCQCPKKCYDLVGDESVKKIFEEYWKMASHNAQSSYLASRVTVKDVIRRYAGPDSKRQHSCEYFVMVNNNKIVVCRTAFCNMHNISAKRVANVRTKMGETGVAPVDRRGTNPAQNKFPDDVVEMAKQHIKSLPTCTSHYSRAKSLHRVYLPPGYSQHKCYDLFKEQCEERDVDPSKIVSLSKYCKIFTAFNIGTNPPMVDTCSTCDRLNRELEVASNNKDSVTHSSLLTQKKVHVVKAKVARNIMDAYSEDNDPSLCVIAMDLQQTLATPRLTTNVAYYKRKMWTYNFGVHNLKESSMAHLYVWNEAVGKRGSSDIGSCLIHYVEHHVPAHCNKLVIFSDNCGGQNKNINLSLLLLRFLHSGRFSQVKQYFLMPGHSYLPCDRDFGNLEKYFHGHEVYTTPHYIELMRQARRDHPFVVKQMDHEDFVDLDPLQALITKAQLHKAGFKDGRMFQFKSDFLQGMSIWQCYNDEITTPVQVKLQKGKSQSYQRDKFDLAAVTLPLKYPHGVKLKTAKLDDLEYLLSFVPLGYKSWYADLFQAQGQLVGDSAEVDPDDPDDVLDY